MKSFYTCLNNLKLKSINKYSRYNLNLGTILEKTEILNFSTVPPSRHRLYGFGLIEHGGLGLKKEKTLKHRYVARPVRHLFGEENSVTDVTCGFGFSVIAINSKDTSKVFGCGINSDKQINGDNYEILHTISPIDIGLQDSSTKVISLSAGRAHLAVATDNEGVFLLGSNCYGQCGRSIDTDQNEGAFKVSRIKVLDEEMITQVCCGQDHTLFLNKSGHVFSCGWGADGQTGLGTTKNVCSPTRVKGDIENEKVVRVVGRSDTVLALNEKGDVFGWGNSEYLQLSPSREIQQINSPRHLTHLSKLGKIKDIAAGGSFCMALSEDGDVYVWGYGILGAGPNVQKSNNPVLLPRTLFGCNESAPDVSVVKVTCGLNYMIAINSSSHMYSWGLNKSGCLGIGHIRDQYFPFKIAVSSLAVKASCGFDHTMVLGKPFG